MKASLHIARKGHLHNTAQQLTPPHNHTGHTLWRGRTSAIKISIRAVIKSGRYWVVVLGRDHHKDNLYISSASAPETDRTSARASETEKDDSSGCYWQRLQRTIANNPAYPYQQVEFKLLAMALQQYRLSPMEWNVLQAVPVLQLPATASESRMK